MKKIIIVCLLIYLSSLAFGQTENKGNIIATFGLGGGVGTIVEAAPQFSIIFDLNFISQTGFTLCLTNITSTRPGALGPSQNMMLGAGYNFLRNKWNIGGTLIASPTAQDLLLGGKINGGYFFTNDLGVNVIVTYRQTAGIIADSGLSMFDAFAGISIRFF